MRIFVLTRVILDGGYAAAEPAGHRGDDSRLSNFETTKH
jgi:hypothetical protein